MLACAAHSKSSYARRICQTVRRAHTWRWAARALALRYIQFIYEVFDAACVVCLSRTLGGIGNGRAPERRSIAFIA